MEGTMIDREAGKYPTEQAILDRMVEILRQTQKNIVFACCSGQNIDRLVTFYKAVRRTKTLLVIDPYTACVLSAIKSPHNRIPQMDWEKIRVFIANYYGKGDVYIKKISESSLKSLIPNLGRAKIKPYDFSDINSKAIVLMRNAMISVIQKIPGIKGAKLVYSQWKGYLERGNPEARKLYSFIDRYKLDLEFVHTSGHATVEDLKSFANALNPKTLIPIHTFESKKYPTIFKNVKILKDGEEFEI